MSSHYVTAQVLAQRARLRDRSPAELSAVDLTEAGSQIERLGLDTERRTRAYIDVLEVALAFVATQLVSSTAKVLGYELTERDIRFGLERQYRALAHAQTGDDERIALIDRANAVRPWTLK
jgi:serine/threonine-protein kinase PknG